MSTTNETGKRPWLESPGAKALLIALLVAVFLIPLSLVQSIVEGRRSTRDSAEASIAEPVGGNASLFGPFLVLPYDLVKGKETVSGEIIVLPESLKLECGLVTENRKRGIFSAPVLTAAIAMRGVIRPSEAVALLPKGAAARWEEARVELELQDLRSLAQTPELVWQGSALALRPDAKGGRVYSRSVSSPVAADALGAHVFSAALKLRGERSLSFLEPAGSIEAAVSGDWPSPSFFGYASPVERSVGKGGFSARWFLPDSAQGLPVALAAGELSKDRLADSAFGLRLLDGVDAYDMAYRAVRYGILFIIAPFALLFLFEIISRSRLHPVQYLLVGLATCLFYLLLLSLSELLGFAAAYTLAALACTLLCGAYSATCLRSRRGLVMAPAMALLYGYLYVALGSEDYALLIGSLGLFAIVAAAMVVTRRVDWYGRSEARGGVDGAADEGARS